MKTVFTIGEFSKITGLTVKTLRFYHEERLLEPTCVDEQSGYRYYDSSKIEAARVISFLRSLDFPVAEIRELLRGSEADMTAALERQRKLIDERMRKLKQVAQSLDQFLASEREIKMLTATNELVCEEKTLQPMLIAAVRMQAPYPECGQGFSRIGKQYWNQICGSALLLCYDQEYQEIANFETCMPIKKGNPVPGIDVRELPGGRCISLLHKGPYTELSRSYQKIMTFCKEQGFKIAVPCREVYLKGPGMFFKGNPRNYLTELQMMIEE
ncbi:MAG: MerR family transcriptional regulator [Pirellulaceae bacterium]|nr:MerR family transcriptional regulator [Pirellulaceae bacterium]